MVVTVGWKCCWVTGQHCSWVTTWLADTAGQAKLRLKFVDDGVGTGHMGGGYCGQDDDEQVGAQSTCKDVLLLVSEYSRLSNHVSVTNILSNVPSAGHSLGHQLVSSLNSHSHIKLNVAATWSSSGERDTMLYMGSGISVPSIAMQGALQGIPGNDYCVAWVLDQSLLIWWTWSWRERYGACCTVWKLALWAYQKSRYTFGKCNVAGFRVCWC